MLKADHPIAVIGAGAWGTALARLLANKGHQVRLWEHFPEYAEELRDTRENRKFLPGVPIPRSVEITSDPAEAVAGAELVVMVPPAQHFRAVARRLAAAGAKPRWVLSASKGIEHGSLSRMTEIIRKEFPAGVMAGALSGPSHAEEVGRDLPTSVVAAADDGQTAEVFQEAFMNDSFRVYTSEDIAGVELGGALKNIIALAAGVVDGLELGDNAKAALITRGLAEIGRMGAALGARAETFAGLSGLGDLVVTCTSRHSRNRRVGEELGRGRQLTDILAGMEMVAEGVETARSAYQLAQHLGVDLPITEQVYRLLFSGLPPAEAVKRLMQRPRKPEMPAARGGEPA
ncbi:MAG: NAD(P)H-dependent glycerol-3-phosphate dehydrogenase [candidate division FCPU426 bacterium]